MFLHPTPPIVDESPRVRTLYAIAATLVAIALMAAALGSGNPDTPPEAKLPSWVDTLANMVSGGLALLVLLPQTRGGASAAAAIMMLASMVANYQVDGQEFFLQALPFNLTTFVLAAWVAQRHRRQVSAVGR